MKILFIGDVFGEPGRKAVKRKLPELRQSLGLDFVIANVENSAHGKGITPEIIRELQEAGVTAFTAGNHIWDNKKIIPYIGDSKVLIRPANYQQTCPGRGVGIFEVYSGIRVGIISLEGQRLMGNAVNSPFVAVDQELERLKGKADFCIVDIHAEATSEKRAMGWHLDGRVAAVVGTHTHVQTADEEILPGGTAYLSDIGMTGPYNSVIGLDKNVALIRFVKQMPAEFKVAEGDVRFCAALIEVEEGRGFAQKITRIQEKVS